MHFLTFGAGKTWPLAARRLANQAQSTRLFKSVEFETGDDFFVRHPDFAQHQSFIESHPRGWGYWIWKPFLVRKHLERLNAGDSIFYLDAGCEILPENREQFLPFFQHLEKYKSLFWDYRDHPIFNLPFWTKQNLIDHAIQEYGLADPLRTPSVWAGGFALVKNDESLSLLNEWLRLATMDGYSLIDDSPSPTPQRHFFIGHRHDQSILSALLAARGIPAFGSAVEYDYGMIGIDELPIMLQKPFLKSRNSLGTSVVAHYRQFPFPPGWTSSSLHLATKLTNDYRQQLMALGLI